jgi:hypothetical protein
MDNTIALITSGLLSTNNNQTTSKVGSTMSAYSIIPSCADIYSKYGNNPIQLSGCSSILPYLNSYHPYNYNESVIDKQNEIRRRNDLMNANMAYYKSIEGLNENTNPKKEQLQQVVQNVGIKYYNNIIELPNNIKPKSKSILSHFFNFIFNILK